MLQASLPYTPATFQNQTLFFVTSSVSLSVNFMYFFRPGATQPIVGVYFTALYRALASSRTRLLDHTQRRVTVCRTPLNE